MFVNSGRVLRSVGRSDVHSDAGLRQSAKSVLGPSLLVSCLLLLGPPAVGDPSPLRQLTFGGETMGTSLESFLGTPTVLYFTHNMCHYCTQIIGFLSSAPDPSTTKKSWLSSPSMSGPMGRN